MTYYYPAGTVLPPQHMEPMPMPGGPLNDKPGIYGAYNGAGMPMNVSIASQPVMSAQYFQSHINPAAGMPPQVTQTQQVFAQHPMHMAPQSVMSPYPASKAGMIPQSHLVATAGLYQGASLAYPQPNVSPAGAMPTRMTLPSNPYAVQAVQVPCPAGRSVSPYAAGSPQLAAMPAGAIPAGAIPTSSAYPGTFISGYTFAGYPNANNPHYSTASIMQQPPQNYSTISVAAAQSAGPPQPIQQQQQPAHTQQFTMSMSNLSTPHQPTHHQPQQSFDPGPTNTILVAQHPRPQMVRTGHPQQMQAMSAAFPQNPAVPQGVPGASASGLPSYPPGVMAASPPGAHHIPGLSPAMGAPLVANPTFPGAAPYPRGLP